MKLFAKDSIHNDIDKPTAIALGNFDGVHIGHQKLIKEITDMSALHGYTSLVWSFETHPENILYDFIRVKSITTLDEKTQLLFALGVDTVYYEDFKSVREMSPMDFIKNILIDKFHAAVVVCGFNYSFGKDGTGDAVFLESCLGRYGVKTIIIPPIICGDVLVSSTFIRYLIENGRMEEASEFLGRNFFITFPVVSGHKLGRTLGTPTINQNFPKDHILPRKGVYAVRVNVGEKELYGISNVGTRPTVCSEGIINCETHILDFNGDLVGKNIRVSFCKRLRDEIKFCSIDELKRQIKLDIASARDYFSI